MTKGVLRHAFFTARDKLEFMGQFNGSTGAAAPSAPSLWALAKIFDF